MKAQLGITTARQAACALVLVLSSAAGCDQEVDVHGESQTIDVTYGDTTVTADLSNATLIDIDGVEYVALQEVVELAGLPGVDIEDLSYDFEGSDGFHPMDSPNCETLIPLGWVHLTNGYIDVVTRDLFWEDATGFPGCMSVDDLARIEASDDPPMTSK
jgi:hypothetical protein